MRVNIFNLGKRITTAFLAFVTLTLPSCAAQDSSEAQTQSTALGHNMCPRGPGPNPFLCVGGARGSRAMCLEAPNAEAAVASWGRYLKSNGLLPDGQGFEVGCSGKLGSLRKTIRASDYSSPSGNNTSSSANNGSQSAISNSAQPQQQYVASLPSDFDVWSYAACNPDLIDSTAVFSSSEGLYKRNLEDHYRSSGRREGRNYRKGCFDGLRYIASYPDLIAAFGVNVDQGTWHYARSGRKEGRNPQLFNCQSYHAKYVDLRNAFGFDCRRLTQHWIESGQREGRSY